MLALVFVYNSLHESGRGEKLRASVQGVHKLEVVVQVADGDADERRKW